MTYTYRTATADDADRIADIHAQSRAAAMPWLPVVHTASEDRWFYRHVVIPDQDVTVCEDADQIVGFVAVTDKWLHHLYLDPALQRKGIGAALLKTAKKARKEINVWVFQKNTLARDFYARNDFFEVELTDGSGNEEKTPDVHLRWLASKQNQSQTK